MYQHILVAVDLVDTDVNVLKAAAKIAKLYNANMTVLHVGEGHVTGYGEGTSNHHIANEMQVKQSLFPKLRALITAAALEEHDTQVLCGRPADVIHGYVHSHDCDLVVVGSHGYSGVKALLGSTANKVLHGASCDVYTVRIDD